MKQTLILLTVLLFFAAFTANAQPPTCITNSTTCELTVIRHCYDKSSCTVVSSSMPQVLLPGNCYTFPDPPCEGGQEEVYEFWWSDATCPPPTQMNHVFITDASSILPHCFPGPVSMPNTGCTCATGPGALITAMPCCINVN
jgi:hypothetical protein